MKPPSRVRDKPDRYSHRKKIEKKKHRKKRLICGSWKRTEQRNLLIGLRKQSKCSGGTGYINFQTLKQKIPQRTVQELETMVETLKSHAVTVTVQQLSRQRRTASAARVPIEVWSQLAEDAAGSAVDPVTSAFSQMMFLCSTEPRSLRNSDPPRSDHCEAQVPSDARTIPCRPMPMHKPALVTLPKPPKKRTRSKAGQPPAPSLSPANPSGGQLSPASSLLSGASSLVGTACGSTNRGASTSEPDPSATATTVTPARLLSGSPASGCGRSQSDSPASILPLGQPGGSGTTSASLTTPASLRGSAEQSSPQPASSSNSTSTSSSFNTTTTSSSSISTTSSSTPAPSSTSSTTSTSTSCTSSSTTTSSSSNTNNTATSSSSKFAQKDSPRTMGLRCIVDFEKIYSYLSQVHKVNQEPCLTPMESAVVLDLLLSLPEELPLLDCVRLEQHMIQAHASLTSPVGRSEAGANMAAQEAQDGGGAGPAGVFHQAQVSGGREAGIGPLPDDQDRDGLQPTNQGEAAVATEAPGNLVPPPSVASDAAQLQRATPGHVGHADGQSPSSQNASGQSRSSSSRCQEKVTNGKASVCPLNPFMVPVQLLARRQAQ